jgi:hypothetical protein
MTNGLKRSLTLAALCSTVALGGCLIAAAGAGAGAAVAYTNRGANSTVDGSVDQVFNRSTAAFQALSITETGRSTEESGTKRRLVGTKGEQEVTVELTRATDATTKVEVIAKKNAVDYDRDLAKDVLTRIIQK